MWELSRGGRAAAASVLIITLRSQSSVRLQELSRIWGPILAPETYSTESQTPAMIWVGRDFKAHLVSPPSHRQGCHSLDKDASH